MFMGSRTNKLIQSTGAVAALLALSCKKEAVTPTPATPIVSAACMDPTASVVITDPTNYALTDSFDMQVATLKDNTDLIFDWSKLTVDFFGKPVNPATDIDTVLISLWQLTPQEIEDELKADDLPLATNKGDHHHLSGRTYTQQNLLSFNELGNPLPTEDLLVALQHRRSELHVPAGPVHVPGDGADGDGARKNPRMISLFHIDPNATQTQARFHQRLDEALVLASICSRRTRWRSRPPLRR